MRAKIIVFSIVVSFLPSMAHALSGSPAAGMSAPSCRTIRLSEIPSADGKLRAVITRSECGDHKSQVAHPWTSLYILKPNANPDNAVPLYLFGYPERYESIESIKKGVPLRVRWNGNSTLNIHYPLGTVVRYVPWGDDSMQKTFWHGVTALVREDASLGNLRVIKPAPSQ